MTEPGLAGGWLGVQTVQVAISRVVRDHHGVDHLMASRSIDTLKE